MTKLLGWLRHCRLEHDASCIHMSAVNTVNIKQNNSKQKSVKFYTFNSYFCYAMTGEKMMKRVGGGGGGGV